MSDLAGSVPARLRRTRRRLRFRIAVSFAAGGLVLTTTLALVTYGLVDRYLLRERQGTAQRQAFLDARTFRDEMENRGSGVTLALQSLELPVGTSVVVRQHGVWYGTSLGVGQTSVPRALRAAVASSSPAQERVAIAKKTAFIVGIPLRSIDADYFEIAVFSELDNSLHVVRNSLIGAAAATTLAATLLGIWAGRRVLRPLHDVSAAASEIAQGDLDRRLTPSDDPDLDPLSLSFNRMVEALQQRIEHDARFVSDASHELRSPLTTLAAAASVIERRHLELPDRLREPVELLLVEIQRFQRLVTELLELSRSEATAQLLESEPILVSDLLRHAMRAARCDEALVDVEPELVQTPILSDKRRLDRVLVNLVENAQTHGGGVAKITVRRRPDGIAIVIEDHGPGILPTEREPRVRALLPRICGGPARRRRRNRARPGARGRTPEDPGRLRSHRGPSDRPRCPIRRATPGLEAVSRRHAIRGFARIGFTLALVGVVVVALVRGTRGDRGPTEIDRATVPFALLRDRPASTLPAETIPREPSFTLYFVAKDGLVAVQRGKLSTASPRDILEALIAGPTGSERDRGLTSLVSSEISVRRVAIDGFRAVIDLAAPLDQSLNSSNRSLPVAQFVYTATAMPGVTEVRFLVNGKAVEVPTGNSTLTRRPVARADYPVSES